MSSSIRRPALGLRGRIVGAVLVTAVATLGVAALAVLGPLEQELRNESLKTLQRELSRGVAQSFTKLKLTYVLDTAAGDRNTPAGKLERIALSRQQQLLGTRLGATVTLLGYPTASGRGQPVLLSLDQTAPADPYDDAAVAFQTHRRISSFGTIDDTQVARVAIPLAIDGQTYVLAVRRPLSEVSGAVHVVQTAFLYAALAGLGLTLLLAIPLAATVVRRLRRLRQAALQLADAGPAVEVPEDRARDEVGDLARAFAAMQRRLQHQEEARRAFVATASHELRTPLTSLEGLLELLDDDLHAPETDLEDARALLERARAQSRRLGRLAADLLDLSRIDAEVQLRSEPVELSELSRAVIAEFELGTAARELTPVLDDSVGPVWARGDPGSVARILRILLENAMRVSPPRSEITVELRNGDRASLSVCDRGPGVDPRESDLIFDRFKRGRATGGQAGFGLGLAIGRELAERMGGELVLEDSEQPGARFTLRLPAARAPESEPLPV
jgi:signal transduction histidine kinase